ncbi:amidohydrolase family protein [Gluconobacter frateurii]|uniref:amidohydrolase family protein n=1 Tax=Gluconobacter frateurii TaxID=38308 RepID=UPI0030B7FC20
MKMLRPVQILCSAAMAVCMCGAAYAAPSHLLVRNALIFSMADGQKTPFKGYFSVRSDGVIDHIGVGLPPRGLKADQDVDLHGHWVMPGFISAHSHLWQAAYRGLAADQTLMGWIEALYSGKASVARPEDIYWFTLDGALDHLAHGVTAAYNFNYGGANPDVVAATDRLQFQAETASGIRFVHGLEPLPSKGDVSLAKARQHVGDFLAWSAGQHVGSTFLSVMINGGTGFHDTGEVAKIEGALMREYHLSNQSHYLEPPENVSAQQARFHWFEDEGILGPHLIFGHFIHTTPEIIARSVKAGASMVWNPLSNGRLASGTADIPAYLKAGLRVGMGEDGEASADLADPFENMRTGLYAIRDKYQSAAIMSPYDVVRLHTRGSADVLEVGDRLGSLEVGKFADFLVIDPTNLGYVFDPYATLVFAAAQENLEQVYVGGVLMVEHGKPLKQDFAHVRQEADRRVAASIQH